MPLDVDFEGFRDLLLIMSTIAAPINGSCGGYKTLAVKKNEAASNNKSKLHALMMWL